MKKSILAIAILISILGISCKKSYNCVCTAENPSTGLYTDQVSSTTIKAKNSSEAATTCAQANTTTVGCNIK